MWLVPLRLQSDSYYLLANHLEIKWRQKRRAAQLVLTHHSLPAMDRYKKLEKIGSGTYGVVYKAKCKDTGMPRTSTVLKRTLQTHNYYVRVKTPGEFVALKKIRLEGDDEGVPSTAIREVSTLLELRHSNVVKYVRKSYEDKLPLWATP